MFWAGGRLRINPFIGGGEVSAEAYLDLELPAMITISGLLVSAFSRLNRQHHWFCFVARGRPLPTPHAVIRAHLKSSTKFSVPMPRAATTLASRAREKPASSKYNPGCVSVTVSSRGKARTDSSGLGGSGSPLPHSEVRLGGNILEMTHWQPSHSTRISPSARLSFTGCHPLSSRYIHPQTARPPQL